MRTVRLAAAAVAGLLCFAGQAAAAGFADRDRDRVFDNLERRLAKTSPGARVDVIVTLRGPATRERVDALTEDVGDLGATRRFTLVDGFAAKLTKAEVYALARLRDVVHVEANLPVRALNNTAQDSFGVAKARLDAGLDGDGDGAAAAYSAADLVAAVLDTGIDATHQDLDEGKVLAFVSCLTGTCTPATPSDPVGHGTHVAATIAGEGDARADRLYRGVAPAAGLVGVRVLDADGRGTMANVVAALDWVVENRAAYGIEAVNLSLGAAGCFNGTDAVSAAVNDATAAGLVVVVAAGNEGPGACTIGLPAAARGAITVGAMGDLGKRGFRLAEFSSRGPTQDGRVKPDIVAPGISLVSAAANSSAGYVPASGTSMATPFVAGVALLMRDANPVLSPAQVRAALTATAVDWGAVGPDGEYGWGRLDAYAAIQAAGASIAAPPQTPAHGFRQAAVPIAGGSVDIPVTVTAPAFPFAATLVAPGWSSAAQTPNFDLTLLDASGSVVASGSAPLTTGWPDRRRQEEVAIAALAAGAYTLRVTAVTGSGAFLVDISGGVAGTPSTPPPPPPPPPPPSVVSAPSIAGVAREDEVLTAAEGTWSGAGSVSFAFQWRRCDPSGGICTDVSGATSRTYTLGRFDVGSTLRVAVTASEGAASASATSAPTAVVGRAGDNQAPIARAVASSGRRGRTVKLFYRVSDLSGRTSERIRVFRAGRVLRTLTTPLSLRETGRTYYVFWRAPRRALRLRFCVQAWDAARNASAPSCAPLRIR
ncbi:MAG TPA: S8 family serine peptidase [Gaiellaceae bacterium]|nr:S8 family serine peptidase [Gaiellaceae bacterium]